MPLIIVLCVNHVGTKPVNEIAEDIQSLDVCPGKTEIHRKIDELSEGQFRRPVLMIGIDGAHAPTRPEPMIGDHS